MKNRILVGALVAGALLFTAGAASPAMAADNLITNGDFSTPAGTVSSGYAAGTNVGGWTIDYSNLDTAPNGLYIQRIGTATSGNINGAIWQSFPTEAGKTYTVSFHNFAGMSEVNTAPVGGNSFRVNVSNGTGLGGSTIEGNFISNSPAVGTVVLKTLSFTATGSTSTLSIGGALIGLDNVSVTEVPVNDSPIMLPALAGGLGVAALAASGFVLRRKNKLTSKSLVRSITVRTDDV